MAPRKQSTAAQSEQDAEAVIEAAPERKERIIPKEIDIHQYIPVKNGFQGLLSYTSKRSGELYEWERFGDEQEMELQELKNAKSSDKGFFQNNWFVFDDEHQWVIDYLGVGAYYKNALKPDQFDDVFTKTPDEIRRVIGGLSDGQKASLGYRAIQLMSEGGIDSLKAIAALEDALGVQLTEK